MTALHDRALLLDEDPDLGEALTEDDRDVLRDLLVARVVRARTGVWQPPPMDPERALGLMVLDGLLGRRVGIGDVFSTELLGAGDILRPADGAAPWALLAPDVSWRVFQPARIALLDGRLTRIIGSRPELSVAVARRLLRRTDSIATLATIRHFPRVEDRVLLALWHLASTWGRVNHRGMLVPFRLTHAVLGEIVGAQRPTVTLAMGALRRLGHVIRDDDGCYVITPTAEPLLLRRRRAALSA